MNHKYHSAVLCSFAVLLAACGSGSGTSTSQAPALAARVQASAPAAATAYYTAVQQIYVGYFGRAADPAGLVYFANNFRDSGAPTDLVAIAQAYSTNAGVRGLIDTFGNSAESAALYPGDNGVFIDAVYQNLFGRAADALGKAYWVDGINKGLLTRANAAVSIMAGAQGTDATIINKKAAVAALFTTTASTTAGQRAYDGLAANAVVRTMLAKVTLATDVAAIQPTLDATLATLVSVRPAAGMYAGTLAGSSLYNMLVLDDDSYFGFYSSGATAPIAPTGMLFGAGASNAGSYASAAIRDFNDTSGATPYKLAATYSAQASFTGNLSTDTGAIGFATTVIDPAIYDYNKPAVLADVTGSWVMRQLSVAPQAITVLADGSFSGSSTGCAVGGLLTPRGNKNVFNVAISFGAGTCPLSGSAVTGVAFSYSLNGGVTRQLYMATTNAAKTGGALLIGTNAIVAGQPTALVITDTVIGTGAVATSGKSITVKYAGYLYDPTSTNLRGTQFDNSDWHSPTTFSFVLGAGVVIPGWDQGFANMRVGGKRTLTIPSSLGYGTTGSGSIPANAGLVFDVELIGVN